jgi:hypothetical protein
VGETAFGVTIYETLEEADSVWRDGKRVRYEPPKTPASTNRRSPLQPQPHVSKDWFPTGRLAVRAYAAERVDWEQTWVETAAGELGTMLEPIGKALVCAVSLLQRSRL